MFFLCFLKYAVVIYNKYSSFEYTVVIYNKYSTWNFILFICIIYGLYQSDLQAVINKPMNGFLSTEGSII